MNRGSKNKKVKEDNSARNAIKFVGLLIVVILFFAYVSKFLHSNLDSQNLGSNLDDQEIHAFITAEKYVKDELPTPSTAEFGYFDEVKVENKGEGDYMIRNFVDYQNIFGATIRSKFLITLHYNGKTWEDKSNWEVKYFLLK